MRSGRERRLAVGSALLILGALTALGNPITFNASAGDRSGTAIFDTAGTDLLVTLSNPSTFDVLDPAYVLTAFFFDVSGPALSLTPVSAVIGPGSTVWFGGTDPGGVVGGEWAYRAQLTGAPLGASYGLSSAGLGLFGPSDLFPGNNLQGPASPDGLQYGLTSLGDDPSTGNSAVTGGNALIHNEVVFRLSGLPAGFDPSTQISNVAWQYGTALSDGFITHEPASVALLAAGVLFFSRRR